MRTLGIVMASLAWVASSALIGAAPAFGQAHPPSQAQDDLQPGVDTSKLAPQAIAQPAPASTPAAADHSTVKMPAAAVAAKSAAHPGKASDRLDLDTTQITGNKELPKVMYVVPWKRADLGDLTGKPANSLVDEVLQPVDRDVFNREERYYHTVATEKAAPAADAAAPTAH